MQPADLLIDNRASPATAGGAAVLGLDNEVSRLTVGDVVLIDNPDWRALIAQLGAEPARVIRP